MKETRNISLSLYEYLSEFIDVEKINNKGLKFFAALALIPFLLFFAALALLIEEPLKCIFEIILFRSSVKEVWIYYNRLWVSLFSSFGVTIKKEKE